jgi:prepilin peptidase CpaA
MAGILFKREECAVLSLIAIIFPAYLVTAALTDLTSFRIPNRLTAAMVVSWPLAAIATDMTLVDASVTIVVALIVFAMGFSLFAANLLGGGDVKLLAAATLWVGAGQTLAFVTYTAIGGAVLAIALVLFRRMPLPEAAASRDWVLELHSRHRAMPYGVAIAAGGCAVWPLTDFFPLW